MKALDWAETFGNFVIIDICPSIYSASEVLNPQSCLHLATLRFQSIALSVCLSILHVCPWSVQDVKVVKQLSDTDVIGKLAGIKLHMLL